MLQVDSWRKKAKKYLNKIKEKKCEEETLMKCQEIESRR